MLKPAGARATPELRAECGLILFIPGASQPQQGPSPSTPGTIFASLRNMTRSFQPPYDPHIVIIGGGFGGLRTARVLARRGFKVTLIDRRSYHLFTPLLYQVATSSLSPDEIAVAIRSLLGTEPSVTCLMAVVEGVDLQRQQVLLDDGSRIDYDYVVVAAGARSHYFGNEAEWSPHVETLDSLATAQRLRDRLLLAFEAAEREADPVARRAKLTFCVIGAGPSGVELAGAIAELGKRIIARDHRQVSASEIRVVLFEAMDRVLTPFPEKLSEKAKQHLESIGVEVRLGEAIERVRPNAVYTSKSKVDCALICWGSGVRPADLAARIDAPKLKGRLLVEKDCTLPGYPNAFAIGDIAAFLDEQEQPLPGLAPVAIQQGRYVARTIIGDQKGRARRPFHYRDKGIMATIGRSRAVAKVGSLKLWGLVAWLSWVWLHIWYLIGFRSKLLVILEWAWAYIGRTRGSRLIEADQEQSPATSHPLVSPQSRRPRPERVAPLHHPPTPPA